MFVKFKKEEQKVPIKIWLDDINEIDELALQQAINLSNLPFLHKWVALMPDTHAGKGMPIGGVIACRNVIIPNAVGVDIGCGMAFLSTNIKVEEIKDIQTGNGTIIQSVIGNIMRNIPVGFEHNKEPQKVKSLEKATTRDQKYFIKDRELYNQLQSAYYQCGSLGGGNHFIELQEDQEGYLCIMIHSGSRNLGKRICEYFNKKAVELNETYYSAVPKSQSLAFFPANTVDGERYIAWMNLALDFAKENRKLMLDRVKDILVENITKHTNLNIEFNDYINCHHNYAALENHYGSNVWVHRKGATRARKGELAVIPGAMGSFSYVVEGLGNEESFHTSSHGAGRKFSRTQAKKEFTAQSVMEDLKKLDVVLGKKNKEDVAEESRFAYKDITKVMDDQKDLIKIIKELKTIGVVKG